MKKLVTVSILLSSLLMLGNAIATPNGDVTSNLATQGVTKKVFSIEKMTCKMCHITVRKAMEKVEGVVKATVNYDTKTATVIFDPKKASIEDIALASTNIGYPATVKPAD
ncbi:MAG TPA: heavy metal transporter [Colwellia sp.]|jgi:mercuric ion binding protein|nr:heavy metal transporter [Colwellia sp.]|tara:strand:- start:7354 stop:7683 length:330 start_codon:yes stop_codon:yes gene_type:complete